MTTLPQFLQTHFRILWKLLFCSTIAFPHRLQVTTCPFWGLSFGVPQAIEMLVHYARLTGGELSDAGSFYFYSVELEHGGSVGVGPGCLVPCGGHCCHAIPHRRREVRAGPDAVADPLPAVPTKLGRTCRRR